MSKDNTILNYLNYLLLLCILCWNIGYSTKHTKQMCEFFTKIESNFNAIKSQHSVSTIETKVKIVEIPKITIQEKLIVKEVKVPVVVIKEKIVVKEIKVPFFIKEQKQLKESVIPKCGEQTE